MPSGIEICANGMLNHSIGVFWENSKTCFCEGRRIHHCSSSSIQMTCKFGSAQQTDIVSMRIQCTVLILFGQLDAENFQRLAAGLKGGGVECIFKG